MTASRILLIVLVAMWGAVGTAAADVAYPARLLVEETTPGSYEVTFTLPIVEGRKLRAEPLLPPSCREVSEREIGVSAIGHTTTWSVTCDPASLAGEAVLIDGLLGTQTELAFTLSTLDGRVYTGILSPSRPGFLVPRPPSPLTIGIQAMAEGMGRVLRQGPLWMLLLVAVVGGARRRGLLAAAVVFAGGHALAQWLGGNGWLSVSPVFRDSFVLVSAAVPAVVLAGGSDRLRGWLQPLWPAALLLGLLYGGARPETLPPDGLSSGEQLLALVGFAVGVGAGVLLMILVSVELRAVFQLVGEGRRWAPATRVIGYAVGSLAAGMILARVVAFGLMAGELYRSPVELVLVAALLGPALSASGVGGLRMVVPFTVLVAVGLAPGLGGVQLPLAGMVVAGSVLLLGSALAADRPLPSRWTLAVGAVAVVAHSWTTGHELLENVSRSTGAGVGIALAATCVFVASMATTSDLCSTPLSRGVRLFGGAVAVAASGWRIADYGVWFDNEVATEAALGLIRLPVLSGLLIVAALLVWPRRGRVLRELGVTQRPRVAHWLLLGTAFLVIPHGTLAVPNPFYQPHAPEGENARRVVSNVLGETYRAFNLTDEDELYDSLADNVTGDLVDNLYLDSRRRLTAGTREGAQVTVRDVSVLDIGEPVDPVEAGSGFAYDCRWVVTARVRHLQHVHHRQNIYNGMLTLRIDGDRWKIAGVELKSEDRVVLPWKPS